MKPIKLRIHGATELLRIGWERTPGLTSLHKRSGNAALFITTPGMVVTVNQVISSSPNASVLYYDSGNYFDESAVDWEWSANQVSELSVRQDQQTCSCHIHILMREGCKCGAIQNERREMK